MARQTRTVIIHGWSDCSDSFVAVKKHLIAQGLGDVTTIYYADYESREDNVTFDDVADALNDRLTDEGFIDQDGKALVDLNVIVHSTGGLVIRHWIARYYLRPGGGARLADCPVKRIVMLAPANFGSPLAHRGKSFLGSLFKGRWKLGDMLEVGRHLLEGLELGSPYQWRLAHRDLLTDFAPYTAPLQQIALMAPNLSVPQHVHADRSFRKHDDPGVAVQYVIVFKKMVGANKWFEFVKREPSAGNEIYHLSADGLEYASSHCPPS